MPCVDWRSALADSPPVEIEVAEEPGADSGASICRTTRERAKRIAAQVNAELQHFLSEVRPHPLPSSSPSLDECARAERWRVAPRMRSPARSVVQPLADARAATRPGTEALRCISVKQAWIYRDWQQAIGNLMIREIEGAVRRFDIIGYGDFEALVRDPKMR